MVLLRLRLLFLLSSFPFAFSTFSPSSSLCSVSPSAHSLVCSCSPPPFSSPSSVSHLRLSSSSLPDLLHHLVVHSCHRLTIASGTFRGKTVLEHIKLLDIAHLDIRADSFRAIRRSPRLFLLQNAHLPALPPRAFTGLSQLQHFWWRNISIGRVHENAFAKMTFVDYLYFHTANIKIIDSCAFGHIHRLGHFFLRDGIRIGQMGARVFCGTRVGELVVEQATVKADDAIFDGLRATKVRISDCWWGAAAGGRRRGKNGRRRERREETTVEVGEMLIRNCTMHRLPDMGNVLISLFHVEHSTIGRLLKAISPSRENANADTPKMPFSFGKERHWHLLSPNNTTQTTTTTTAEPNRSFNSTFYRHRNSQKTIPLLQLRILYSNIRVLCIPSGTVPISALSHFRPSSSVLFRNSSVRRWVDSPFAVPSFSIIRKFLIENCRLEAFVSMPNAAEEGPFSHLFIVNSFRIVRSQIDGAQLGAADGVPSPFNGSKIGILELAECRLTHAPGSAFMRGVEIRERLTVNGTQWPCARDHCGTEGLFLAPNSHRNLHWHFTSNRCFEENFSSTLPFVPTATPSKHSSPSNCESSHASTSELVCRQMGPLEECMCHGAFVSSAHPRRHFVHMPSSSSALLFLIGDCAEHSFVLQSSAFPSSVQSLYIFRVRQLIIRSIPPSLRHLNILHSPVTISNFDAFSTANLFQLAVDGSDLVGTMPKGDKLRKGAAKLGQIRLDGVNDGWRELIRELTDQKVAEEGIAAQQQQWHDEKGTDEAMAMPRRRGVGGGRRTNGRNGAKGGQWERMEEGETKSNDGQNRRSNGGTKLKRTIMKMMMMIIVIMMVMR